MSRGREAALKRERDARRSPPGSRHRATPKRAARPVRAGVLDLLPRPATAR